MRMKPWVPSMDPCPWGPYIPSTYLYALLSVPRIPLGGLRAHIRAHAPNLKQVTVGPGPLSRAPPAAKLQLLICQNE